MFKFSSPPEVPRALLAVDQTPEASPATSIGLRHPVSGLPPSPPAVPGDRAVLFSPQLSLLLSMFVASPPPAPTCPVLLTQCSGPAWLPLWRCVNLQSGINCSTLCVTHDSGRQLREIPVTRFLRSILSHLLCCFVSSLEAGSVLFILDPGGWQVCMNEWMNECICE